MINSIQSYNPKTRSNNAKTNNSPNFGMKVECEIVTEKAQKAVETLRAAARNGEYNPRHGFLTAIATWIEATKKLLQPLAPDNFNTTILITNINPDSLSINANLVVQRDEVALDLNILNNIFDRIINQHAFDSQDGLFLDPQCVIKPCQQLIDALDKIKVPHPNPNAEVKAGESLLPLIKITN